MRAKNTKYLQDGLQNRSGYKSTELSFFVSSLDGGETSKVKDLCHIDCSSGMMSGKLVHGRALNIALERALRADLMVEGLAADAHVDQVMVSLATRFSRQKVKGHAHNMTTAQAG